MKDKIIQAKVEEISPLTDSIMRLVLKPDEFVEYQAGQYLQILFAGEAFSYSIANASLGSHKYELHMRHSPDNANSQRLFTHIKQQGHIQIRLPYGECSINHLDANRPIIFIAGGTGFAPVKAMIEQLLADADSRAFELYWGARSRSDLYLNEKVSSWEAHVSHFNYYSLLASEGKATLASFVLEHHRDDINRWQVVISGPFDMVYTTRDLLVKEGMSPAHLFSDAFSFEPKK